MKRLSDPAFWISVILLPILLIVGVELKLSPFVDRVPRLPHKPREPLDFLHTKGSTIVDGHNDQVRLSGLNWSGFETKEAVAGGLDTQDYRAILRVIKQEGYNTVRLPFSNEMLHTRSVPQRVAFEGRSGPINTDLRGLTSLEILDKVIAYAGDIGLKIILDNHRSEAGDSAEESGLWFSREYPESTWREDWITLTRRYMDDPTVIGMDLRNEPHNATRGGACWDCGGTNDWHLAAQRVGNAILAVNPHVLIFVEGVDTYLGDSYWWGGNLEGVRRSPVFLSVPNQLVYSAHEYGPAEYAQPWFNTSTSYSTLAALWRRHWGYVSDDGIAPVWIGEFGVPNRDDDVRSSIPGSEGQWFSGFMEYLYLHPDLNWTYWSINGEDRYGMLDATYSARPANRLKAEALESIRQAGSNATSLQVLVRTPVSAHLQLPVVPIPNRAIPSARHESKCRTRTLSGKYQEPVSRERGLACDSESTVYLYSRLPQVPTEEEGLRQEISHSIEEAVTNANLRIANDARTLPPKGEGGSDYRIQGRDTRSRGLYRWK